MSGELLKSQTAAGSSSSEGDTSSIVVGQVVNNCDHTARGRVRVRLAWRGGMEIWARLALLDNGTYFIPQKGDEVLVAVYQKDVNEAYVLGRLWNDSNQVPRKGQNDPNTKRVIRTPGNHEIAFDEDEKSVVIKTGSGQTVVLKPNSITLAVDDNDSAKITLDKSGTIEIKASTKIKIDAPNVDINGSTSTKIDGGTINIG
jgi:uncharacterized protein involved in type VI secretion and phage assembly